VRLYETGAVFAQAGDGRGTGGVAAERRVLALLIDVPGVGKGKTGTVDERQAGVRLIRGSIEAVARALGGARGTVEVRAGAAPVAAFEAGASGEVLIHGTPAGWLGLIDPGVQRQFDLGYPQAAAEIDLDALGALYPPKSSAHALPAFPPIERDLSLVVDEGVTWAAVRGGVEGAGPALLESVGFVGTYRGRQLGPGKKSVTLRMRFRDPARTLRHEEVDPQVAAVLAAAAKELRADVRK
jgi:phenylalanyl-tRNA synthetase beta chain